MSDYHLHLHPHTPTPDAPPPGVYPPGHIDSYIEHAIEHGVTELGFTEHLYRCIESTDVLGRWWEHDPDTALAARMESVIASERNLSLEKYVEVVLDAKDRGLPVLLGLEVDFQPGTEEAVLDLLSPYPFDFLIGSVHWIGAFSFQRPTFIDEFERRGARRSFEQYFALENQLAASGMVDVLAHVDSVKRMGMVPDEPIIDLYEEIVATTADAGIAIEVSSAGLRSPIDEIYPAPPLLQMFHDAGVPITLASDAHFAHMAGQGHALVTEAALRAGYTEQANFSQRTRFMVPLDDPSHHHTSTEIEHEVEEAHESPMESA